MAGVETIKLVTGEVADCLSSLAKIVDGGIDLTDLPEGWNLMTEVRQLGKDFNLEAMKEQLEDADQVEKLEVYDVFKSRFNLDNDTLEGVIEEGLLIVFNGAAAIFAAIDLAKKVIPK